jgi:Flp pilus assembly protein TadD
MSDSRRHDGGAGTVIAPGPTQLMAVTAVHPMSSSQDANGSTHTLEQYRNVARKSPNDPRALKDLADYLLVGTGNPDEAFEVYQRVLFLKNDDPEILQILGNLSVSLRRFGSAREYYGRLAALQPWNLSARKSLQSLTSLQPTNQTRETRDEFREAIVAIRKSVDEGDDNKVHEHIDRLMSMKEEAVRAHTGMKRTASYTDIQKFIATDQTGKAIAALESYVQAYPEHALAHNDLGVLYYRTGQPREAIEQYRLAVDLDGENPVFRKNLADFLYVEQGDLEGAGHQYVHVLRHQPKDVEALIAFGHICTDLGKPADAEFFFNKVIEIQPWNVTARHSIDALRRTPDAHVTETSVETEYQRLRQLAHEGDAGGALEAFSNFAARYPQHAAAQNDLGVLSYQSGRNADALLHYETATRLEPANTTFQKNLADFLFVEERRYEDAMRIYVTLLKSHPIDVEILFGIGRMCDLLERPDDARVFYSRVLDLEPANAAARQALDQLPRTQGR